MPCWSWRYCPFNSVIPKWYWYTYLEWEVFGKTEVHIVLPGIYDIPKKFVHIFGVAQAPVNCSKRRKNQSINQSINQKRLALWSLKGKYNVGNFQIINFLQIVFIKFTWSKTGKRIDPEFLRNYIVWSAFIFEKNRNYKKLPSHNLLQSIKACYCFCHFVQNVITYCDKTFRLVLIYFLNTRELKLTYVSKNQCCTIPLKY